MREMKDSGIEWIGEIPKSWRTVEVKVYCKSVYAGGTPQSNNSEYWDGEIPWLPSGVCHDCKVYTASKYITKEGFENSSTKHIPANTALVAMTGATCGNTAFLTFNACANQSVAAYVAKDNTSSLFLWYLIQAAKEHLLTFQTGGAQGGVNVDNCKNIIVPYVPYEYQIRIADYLEKKCAKIDAIIEKQQEIIEKLKEYKLSIISEAVTKGLKPDVEMKDSGAEFVGKIPNNWSVAKLGNLFDFIGGYAFNSDMYVPESNNQVVRIGNIKNGYMPLDSNPVYVSDETAEKADRFLIKPGYILFTMTGTKGKRDYFFTHVVSQKDCEEKRLYINQRVGCFVAKEGTCPDYYGYLLKDNRILDGIFLYETGTANQGNLGIDSISRTKVHVPTYDEQVKISEYLGERCGAIDKSIEGRIAVVDKLTTYKKSLIYEVVTGKREV